MASQSSMFSFLTTSKRGVDDTDDGSKRKSQKKAFEACRDRKFLSSWLTEFPWVKYDDEKCLMFCKVRILTLPMSTASCERGFSCMKRVMSDWRSSLNTETLSMLMYLSIEGPEPDGYNSALAVQRWWEEGERARRPT